MSTTIPKLQALPGRVLLQFDPPQETKGLIVISEKSRRRSEVGTIISIGQPLDFAQAIICRNLCGGDRVPVTYGAGVSWYFGEYQDGEFSSIRAFSIGELAAKVIE